MCSTTSVQHGIVSVFLCITLGLCRNAAEGGGGILKFSELAGQLTDQKLTTLLSHMRQSPQSGRGGRVEGGVENNLWSRVATPTNPPVRPLCLYRPQLVLYKWPTRTILISNKPPKKNTRMNTPFLPPFFSRFLFIYSTNYCICTEENLKSIIYVLEIFFFHLQSGLDSDPRSKIAFLMNVRH